MITTLSKALIKRTQAALKKAGFDPGSADGDLGPRTLQAMASYLAPSAPKDIGPILDKWLPVGEITTRDRLIAFFGHVAHESGFEPKRENLNYSVSGLLANFGAHRISRKDVDKFGRTQSQAADQVGIANAIYGGDWGRVNLGNTEPGDGWRFRGGGGIQNTGRTNARAVGPKVGLDLEKNPELLSTPEGSIAAAVGFWMLKSLNAIVDQPGDTTAAETLKINGGSKGLAERRAFQARLAAILV